MTWDQHDGERPQQQQQQQQPAFPLGAALQLLRQQQQQRPHPEEVEAGSSSLVLGKTIVASDNEVSNGFVKEGRRLPYVFEATESGNRKRSSKILPVCGVCGKRFVCVTTMKRHLVTHTGEKPFACKVCGKQYTQKGNLRVHERTHRNDRPFECDICHQKFYRKEPMQKHQWRQHGVVHFKQAETHNPISVVTHSINKAGENGSVLYNSIVDRIRRGGLEESDATSRGIGGPAATPVSPPPPPPPPTATAAPAPLAYTQPLAEQQQPYRLLVVQQQESQQQPLIYRREQPLSSAAAMAAAALNMASDKSDTDTMTDKPTDTETKTHDNPLSLKKKLAHLYQQEEEEEATDDSESEAEIDDDEDEAVANGADNGESVSVDCRGCGANLAVSDPFNFRCPECKARFTSLPTGVIAGGDPLQCLGCRAVFPHKPALKAHQQQDGPRPFRCCKCGYSFRQKAHLQKHQWRIHRRKAGAELPPTAQPAAAHSSFITMQDIIDHSIEKSLTGSEDGGDGTSRRASPQPLDLSPSKQSSDEERPRLLELVATLPSLSPLSGTERTFREDNPLLRASAATAMPAGAILTMQASQNSPAPSTTKLGHKRQRTDDTVHNLPPVAPSQQPSTLRPLASQLPASRWLDMTQSRPLFRPTGKETGLLDLTTKDSLLDLSSSAKTANKDKIGALLTGCTAPNNRTV